MASKYEKPPKELRGRWYLRVEKHGKSVDGNITQAWKQTWLRRKPNHRFLLSWKSPTRLKARSRTESCPRKKELFDFEIEIDKLQKSLSELKELKKIAGSELAALAKKREWREEIDHKVTEPPQGLSPEMLEALRYKLIFRIVFPALGVPGIFFAFFHDLSII